MSSGLKKFNKKMYKEEVSEILNQMTLREKIGQMLMVDFRKWTVAGKEAALLQINPEVTKVISDYKLGGIILFKENIVDTEQVSKLNYGFQNSVSNNIPLFIAIDQEGGLVTRIPQGTQMPGNMALGAIREKEMTYKVAHAIGRELIVQGININFAPTIDVNSNYKNPVIGIRSFGEDPILVSDLGDAYVKGLQSANVGSAAKHFPGHGDTDVDSHFGLPVVDKEKDSFYKVDLQPFFSAAKSNVDMIMTAHVVVPCLDNEKIMTKKSNLMQKPATFSKAILTDIVRNEMDYNGIIITDALNMKAISDNFYEAEAVVKTFAAGADIALMPTTIREINDLKKLDEIFAKVETAVREGVLCEKDIDKSVKRILNLKYERSIFENSKKILNGDMLAIAKKVVGSKEHKLIEKEAADMAVTLIKNTDNILPFTPVDNERILIISGAKDRAKLIQLELSRILKEMDLLNVSVSLFLYSSKSYLNDELKRVIKASDYIIMETENLKVDDKFILETVKYCSQINSKLVGLSVRNPYDIMYILDIKANIAVYGSSGYDQTQAGRAPLSVNIGAGIDAIFGKINPKGKLPVSIKDYISEEILYNIGHGLFYDD